MEILDLPVSQLINAKVSLIPNYLLELNFSTKYKNHINSYHGGILYTFSETCAGYFLDKIFSENKMRVSVLLRSSKIKYTKTCNDTIYSNAKLLKVNKNDILEKLSHNKTCVFEVEVSLYDSSKNIISKSEFEWVMSCL